MNDALSLLTGVVVVLAITAVTAYFVAQEFAYMSVDRSKLTVARRQAMTRHAAPSLSPAAPRSSCPARSSVSP